MAFELKVLPYLFNNTHSSLEVNYWCQALNCTETRLRNAVLVVGPLVADVRAYLLR